MRVAKKSNLVRKERGNDFEGSNSGNITLPEKGGTATRVPGKKKKGSHNHSGKEREEEGTRGGEKKEGAEKNKSYAPGNRFFYQKEGLGKKKTGWACDEWVTAGRDLKPTNVISTEKALPPHVCGAGGRQR